jgi:amino-acid N-acetyltransferase
MTVHEYRLRPAAAADDAAIRRLIREGEINPMGLDWQRFTIAEAPDGTVVACGQIKPHQDGSHELASIAVTAAWRGRGLARAIIESLLAAHPGVLYLMCESSLEPLYEKFGFARLDEAEYPRYFRRMKKLMALPEKLSGFEISIMRRAAADGTAA